jgi:hypothetical protein
MDFLRFHVLIVGWVGAGDELAILEGALNKKV